MDGDIATRILAGVIAAGLTAWLALRHEALSAGGALASVAIGILALSAGWNWGVLLLLYFTCGMAVSRFRRGERDALLASRVAKGGRRDYVQVLSNGAVFAAVAALALVAPAESLFVCGAGALSASMADTWATEIGAASRTAPRSILDGRQLPVGISGGVTPAGTMAALAGAALFGIIAATVGQAAGYFIPVAAAGVVGSTVDSVLGAGVQEKRFCGRCSELTERMLHTCGEETIHHAGVPRMNNDAVNLLTTLAGAMTALALTSR
jgi:uncharacterized protein (TIGR00297 family)